MKKITIFYDKSEFSNPPCLNKSIYLNALLFCPLVGRDIWSGAFGSSGSFFISAAFSFFLDFLGDFLRPFLFGEEFRPLLPPGEALWPFGEDCWPFCAKVFLTILIVRFGFRGDVERRGERLRGSEASDVAVLAFGSTFTIVRQASKSLKGKDKIFTEGGEKRHG